MKLRGRHKNYSRCRGRRSQAAALSDGLVAAAWGTKSCFSSVGFIRRGVLHSNGAFLHLVQNMSTLRASLAASVASIRQSLTTAGNFLRPPSLPSLLPSATPQPAQRWGLTSIILRRASKYACVYTRSLLHSAFRRWEIYNTVFTLLSFRMHTTWAIRGPILADAKAPTV